MIIINFILIMTLWFIIGKLLLDIWDVMCYNVIDTLIKKGDEKTQMMISKVLGV